MSLDDAARDAVRAVVEEIARCTVMACDVCDSDCKSPAYGYEEVVEKFIALISPLLAEKDKRIAELENYIRLVLPRGNDDEYEIRWDEEKTCGEATLEDGIYIAMIRFVGDGRCRYEVVLSTPAADSERQNFSHTSFSVRTDAQGRENNLQEMLDLIVRCARAVKSKGEN